MSQNDNQSGIPTDQQILTFGQKMKSSVSYLWANHKAFLIVFGILIVLGKLTGLIMDFIAYRAKQTLDNAVRKDDQLKKEEDAANTQANALRDEANELPLNENPVNEDWYKNGKK